MINTKEVMIMPVSIPKLRLHEKEVGSRSFPLMHLSYRDLPVLYVNIRNVWFKLLMDTSVKHNLIDPYWMEWIIAPEPSGDDSWDRFLPTDVIHEQMPEQTVMCKDGLERPCAMIKLGFCIAEVDGTTHEYSETFALDPSMSSYFLLPENSTSPEGIIQYHKTIVGVLGMDFLLKHEFCLDFSKQKE